MKIIETVILCVVLFFLLLLAVPAIAIRISELALIVFFLVVILNVGKPR